MSGHSKWHSIKHKKGAADAKRGKLFTQLGRAITVAARKGGGDPKFNFSLRLAIDKAKAGNMPKDNIEKAIKRGTGELEGATIEEKSYEGYGPNGIAFIVDALTDNPNRTVADLKHIFTKHGGKLEGSVAWLFEQKGVILLQGQAAKAKDDEWLLRAIDNGIDDFQTEDDLLIAVTDPKELQRARDWLENGGLEIESAELRMIPKETIELDEATRQKIENIIEALEENDDVEKVYTNIDD